MATAYLNDGATSFAAASWSDATGFANGATLVVPTGGQSITASLDQSALTGINFFRVSRPFTGNIGSPSAGPLKVDVDDVTGEWNSGAGAGYAKLEYLAGGGQMYYQAAGNSNVCENLFIDTGGEFYAMGGTFNYVKIYRASRVNFNASSTIGTANLYGPGGVTLEYKSSGLTTLNVFGGSHVVRRPGTTINVYGGTVTYDVETGTTTTINQYGGTVFHVAGAVTTWNGYSGVRDSSRLRREATIATQTRTLAFRYDNSNPNLTITTTTRIDPIAPV